MEGSYGTEKDYRVHEGINKRTERGQAKNSASGNGTTEDQLTPYKVLFEKIVELSIIYDIIFVLSYQYLATGGGVNMEVIITFLVAVMADVACHYITKWLDSDRKDNE